MKQLTTRIRRYLAGLLVAGLSLSLIACGGGAPQKEGGDAKTLRVAMECAYAPYNWTQNTDENGAVPIEGSSSYANGYDVMMAKRLAEKLGRQLVIVKSDWDSLIPAVQSGTVDCAIAGQSITQKRLQNVDFTQPYYYATVVTLMKKDSPYIEAKSVADLAGAKVTSQLNTIWYDSCLPQIPQAQILAGQADAPAALVALDSGSCDLIVTDAPTAKAALIAYPDFRLLQFDEGKDFKVSDEDINIGISLKKGNQELAKAMNDYLGTLTEKDFSELMDQAIAIQPLSK